MNEMISVKTNGSWVTRIMKISAGRSGARRAQSPAARMAFPPPEAGAVVPAPAWGSRAVLTLALASLLVLLGHLFGGLLTLVQRLVDRLLPRDGGADVLRYPRTQVRELGDADELDARRRSRLHARVVRVGRRDRVLRRFRERACHLQVVGVGVGRGALARGHLRPALLLTHEVLVALARGPRNELPRVVLLLAGLLDGPGPGVEPARLLGLDDGGGNVPDLALDRGVVGLERTGGRRRVVPHRDIALLHGVQALGEARLGGAVLAVRLDQVDVEVGGFLELRRVDLGRPVLLEPGAAKGVDDGGQRSEDLAP